MKKQLLVLAFVGALAPLVASAGMSLYPLFGDHAVVQRDKAVWIWGEGARPSADLDVTLGAAKGAAIANMDGTFRCLLPAQPAGGPYTLTVKDAVTGESVDARDVWVGEVWVASGQSNMAFEMHAAKPGFDDPEVPLYRNIALPHFCGLGPLRKPVANWEVCTKASLPAFTAVGSFFARELVRRLGCAVGIVNHSWGGTCVECWTSRNALLADPESRSLVENFERRLTTPEPWAKRRVVYTKYPLDDGIRPEARGWSAAKLDVSSWTKAKLPGYFSDHFGRDFNGAVWYRRTVKVPAAWKGRDLDLRLGCIDKQDQAWVNGVKVGATGQHYDLCYWNVRRVYRVPAKLVESGELSIAVRVWSQVAAGGFSGEIATFAVNPVGEVRERVPLEGEWVAKIEKEAGFRDANDFVPQLPGDQNCPGALFDARVEPLLGLTMRGIVWYQGESNSGNAEFYRHRMGVMIRDWRYRWGIGDFPFVQVELAGYHGQLELEPNAGFAKIRNAQLLLTRDEPAVGLVSALDVGDVKDIHPKDKKTVGERLARWAFAHVYGLETVATGPGFLTATDFGGKVRVTFSDVGSGLVSKNPADATLVRGCFVFDGKGKSYPAVGRIVGDTLEISCDKLAKPVRVCYAYASFPKFIDLYNREGLPATPFMLDVR